MPPRIRSSLNIFMELRKICQHPYLVAPELENHSLPENEQHRLLVQGCGKMAFLKILLPRLKERGHRVLLFSQFKIALDWIQDFLTGEGYSFLRLDGDVQQAQRQKSIDAFNAPGSEHFIFLLTTRAGGVGINLATADTVIVYDPDFNPHQDLQAIARSHRYGQNKKVLVFKLMTKDSIEEQIVYNGKKKMVLDHLVVQNLGKDNEEEDVSSMLLAGAKALYETNADGISASDISYTPKQVEEMIDKVEKQAEEEAVLYQQKWDKDDAMTEDERLAALNTKGSETMNFAFAKIWEMDKGELEEVDGGGDMEDEMDDNWMTVFENAEKERARKEAEEIQHKKERRKRIDYGFDDTPKKKNGKSKTNKSKDRSRETSIIRQYQSSDSEFHIGTGEVSADDSTDLEVIPEDMPDLTNGPKTSLPHDGTMKKKKSELNKMERRALRKRLEDEMIRKAAIIQIQATTDPNQAGTSTTAVPAQTNEEAFFTDLASRRNNLNKIEKTALRKYLNEKVKAAGPPRPRKNKSQSTSPTKRNDPGASTAPVQSNEDAFLADLVNKQGQLSEAEQQAFLKSLNDKVGSAQNRPTSPTKQNEAGPSTNQAWPNMTGHIMTTNGQFSEVQKQKSTDSRAEAMALWAKNALKKKADLAGRAELRKELERSMQDARQAHQQAGQMLDRPAASTGVRDAFRENLVRIQRQAEQEVENIERNIEREANAMEASRNAVPSVPPPSGSRPDLPPLSATSNRPTSSTSMHPPPSASTSTPRQQQQQRHQAALVQMARIVSNPGEVSSFTPSSATSNTSIRPTTNNTMHPLPSTSTSTSQQQQQPALVQMANTASKQGEIAKAQEIIVWLWHHLTEFGLRKEIKLWAKMTLSEVPPNERRSIYSTLAKVVDHLLRNTGHLAYYTDPRHKHCLQILFDEAAPGVGHGGLVPKMPTGFGRLIGPPSQSNGQGSNIAGPSRPANGNGQASVPSIPQLDPSTIARPAAPLVTPQQRAAIARSAIPPAGAQLVTQPRQPSNPTSNQISGTPAQAIGIPCPFCGKLNHNATTCPERRRRPLSTLRNDLEACQKYLATNAPSTGTALQRLNVEKEVHEIKRLMKLQGALDSFEQPSSATSGPEAGPSSAHATTPSSAGTPVFGLPPPPRLQKRVSGPGPSPSNGNGTGHGTAGTSKDNAIAIDDDDDDNTVALSTPAIPPTPAPLAHLPSASTTYAAPPLPGYPPPYTALPAQAPPAAAQDTTCPMCRKLCGLDLRTCAENHGGRKGLKDRIRSLNADGHGGGDGITALYETYQAWPREETPRKRVKRERA